MAQDWDIKPRSDTCSKCEIPFEDGQTYFSALVFGAEGYRRNDFCGGCWEQMESGLMPYSAWQGTFRLPPTEPEEALKKETAESLLRRLMEDDDPARVNVIYILAVMLERKRILVERKIEDREDGTTIRVYEHRRTGETFLIPEPRLRLDQLEHVQQEVLAMLGGPQPAVDEEASGEQDAMAETPAGPLSDD